MITPQERIFLDELKAQGKSQDELRSALGAHRIGLKPVFESKNENIVPRDPTRFEEGGVLEAVKDFGVGAIKGVAESSIDTARLLQTAGQGVLAGITPGKSFQDIKSETGIEALQGEKAVEIDAILKSENSAEKAGKLTAFIGELLTPTGSRKAFASGAKAIQKVASKTGDELLEAGTIAKNTGEEVLSSIAKPENIMQRVARINPSDQVKFEKQAGETVGDYLVKRKIFGTPEEVAEGLVKRFEQSKSNADEALATLKGKFKPTPVKTVLKQLLEKEKSISSPGALSKDFRRVRELNNKMTADGLDMSEINEVKRLFERNVKLDFLKQNLPDGVKASNTLDDAIRKWQVGQAEKLGLSNLPDLNKETQLAKSLADKLGKKLAGSGATNAISLTDWIILAGGDTTAIGGFVGKKILSSKGLQSKVAKKLSEKKPKMDVKAKFKKAKPGFTDFIERFKKK